MGSSASDLAVRRPASLVRGHPASRRLRAALLWLVAVGVVPSVLVLSLDFPIGVDAGAPLVAAERWIQGQTPYLANSFGAHPGLDVPFLYAPYVLPYLAPLLAFPRLLVVGAALMAGLGAAILACRRLGVPAMATPVLLLWPPFVEGIWVANVQLIAFAAFVLTFWVAEPTGPWRPRARRLEASLGAPVGLAAAAVAVVKVSQVQAWVVVLRRAPHAALAAAAVVGVIVLATLPFTGLPIYGEWLDQVRRAADPAWALIGSPLLLFLPAPLAWSLAALSIVAMLLLPRRDAGAWAGIATLVAAPNVHTYTWLFLLPAMLSVRREVALLAALAVATSQPAVQWLGLLAVAACLGLSGRWPTLREPRPRAAAAGLVPVGATGSGQPAASGRE